MNRLWLAGGIFAAILALCLSTLLYQRRQSKVLLDDLDAVIAAYDAGEQQRAYELATELEKNFQRQTRLFPCFMAHGILNECRESLALLPSILKEDNAEEFRMESSRCRVQLERLVTSELPILENIL